MPQLQEAAILASALFVLYQFYSFLRTRKLNKNPMKISEIYVYPIKSLRGTQLNSSLATKYGLEYDRRFMLLQATSDGYKNMAVSRYPEMTQLLTSIDVDKAGNGTVTVTFRAFGSKEATKTLKVPLKPNIEKLEPFNVDMHGSPTAAFKMPTEYNTWFSECFGYDVVFVYLGDNRRDVLFKDLAPVPRVSWLANLTSSIINPDRFRITFADCAPYLIVSKTSLADVSSRLPPGQNMDVTKFRPNIVLEGAEEAWEEDYWRKIKIGNAEVTMNHNCVRCKSINVDYETGKPGTGESGEVLKKLQKDRRVDTGAKWSPVFGRYSFWSSKSADQMIKVGDLVEITEVSKERTAWNWPGIG